MQPCGVLQVVCACCVCVCVVYFYALSTDVCAALPPQPSCVTKPGFAEVAKPYGDTDKVLWHNYQRFYDRVLAPFRMAPVRLLEIGVRNGGSLKLWTAYFPAYEHVYGLAYGEGTAKGEVGVPKTTIIEGDQSKKADLDNLVRRSGGNFHIIVDDGSHVPFHQLFTFLILFPHLKPGGVYVIEDVETSYWSARHAKVYGYPIRRAGLNRANSIVEVFTYLTSTINRQYHANSPSSWYVISPMEQDIASIEFGQNCIFVHKNAHESWKTRMSNIPYRLSNMVDPSLGKGFADSVQTRLKEGFPELYGDGEYFESLRQVIPSFGKPRKG